MQSAKAMLTFSPEFVAAALIAGAVIAFGIGVYIAARCSGIR